MIEDRWRTVALPEGIKGDLLTSLQAQFTTSRETADLQQASLRTEKAKLLNRRKRLMEAIYAEAVPLEEIADEQKRLAAQIAAVDARMQGTQAEYSVVSENLIKAIDLAADCGRPYADAPDACSTKPFSRSSTSRTTASPGNSRNRSSPSARTA